MKKNIEQLERAKELRFNNHWTLQKIGDELGITRQRVHQLLGNTGDRIDFSHDELIKYINYTNKEIAEIFGVTELTISKATNRLNIRNKIDSNFGHGKNYKAENLVIEKLESLGFKDIKRFPSTVPYNLIINGLKIRIASSYTPKKFKDMKNVSPSWRFSLGRSKGIADLFIFVIYPLAKFFVIPSSDIPQNRTEIVFSYPTEYRNSGKWQSYENKFEFLENFS